MVKDIDRNNNLHSVLSRLRKDPDNRLIQEEWALAAQDLTLAVFTIQFASMKDSPDREDLLQSAALEFHRFANRFAELTRNPKFNPKNLFRFLYSVAKYSMFRELKRLRKHEPDNRDEFYQEFFTEDLEETSFEDEEPAVPGPDEVIIDAICTKFVHKHLPKRIMEEVDKKNVYKHTPWGHPVRFCAQQRLRGHFVSPLTIKSIWSPPNAFLVVAYADYLVRNSICALSNKLGPKVSF